jgi:hypothetical protein
MGRPPDLDTARAERVTVRLSAAGRAEAERRARETSAASLSDHLRRLAARDAAANPPRSTP